jgi:hypothetical protein
MDKKTLNALKKSITKWERNVKNAQFNLEHDGHIRQVLISSKDCPLCVLFGPGRLIRTNSYYKPVKDDCVLCPIKAKTGKRFCKCTPYSYVESYLDRRCFKSCVRVCEEEVKFLKSLLPKNPKH